MTRVLLYWASSARSFSIVKEDPLPETIERHGMEGMSWPIGHGPGPVRTWRRDGEHDGIPVYREVPTPHKGNETENGGPVT